MLHFKTLYPYLIAFAGFGIALLFFICSLNVDVETYKQLRGSLFTGFFTVAGFLLSAKTLIILNMKKEVYEKESYLEDLHNEHWSKVEAHWKQGSSPRAACGQLPSVYAPLSRIGTLLTVNIVLSLATSFSQITIGLTDTRFAIVVCLSLAVGTAFLLGCSVYLMWQNFHALYKSWESQAQLALDKQWAKALKDYNASRPSPGAGHLPTLPSSVVDDASSPTDM